MSKSEIEVSTGDGSVRVLLHPRLSYGCCSSKAVNQERHAMAVGRRAATSIRQVDQEPRDVILQPKTQDLSGSRREPRRTWRIIGAG